MFPSTLVAQQQPLFLALELLLVQEQALLPVLSWVHGQGGWHEDELGMLVAVGDRVHRVGKQDLGVVGTVEDVGNVEVAGNVLDAE